MELQGYLILALLTPACPCAPSAMPRNLRPPGPGAAGADAVLRPNAPLGLQGIIGRRMHARACASWALPASACTLEPSVRPSVCLCISSMLAVRQYVSHWREKQRGVVMVASPVLAESGGGEPTMQHPLADAAPPAGASRQRQPEQVAFAVEDMAATTWEQLALRVGWATGYVYCHQGCCEHALYIADARRVHPDDPRRRSAYPLQSFQARAHGCMVHVHVRCMQVGSLCWYSFCALKPGKRQPSTKADSLLG